MSNDLLKANRRTRTGKNALKKVRNEHFIPGVLYGHHIDNVNISIAQHDMDKFYKKHGIGASLDLEIDGNSTFVLFKNADIDTLRNQTVHVEFQALAKGEKIKIKVPVHYTNKDTIPAGLIFQELHHEVEIQVLPKDLFEAIDIDLKGAGLGDSMTIEQLEIFKSDAFEFLDPQDTLLYTVTESQVHLELDPDLEAVPADEIPQVGEEEE